MLVLWLLLSQLAMAGSSSKTKDDKSDSKSNGISVLGSDSRMPSTHPVALVTFHGGDGKKEINNIYKYEFVNNPSQFTFAGQLLNNQVALGLHSLRGMAYVPQTDQLYFVNAYRLNSELLIAEGVSTGSAPASVAGTVKLKHPYGIAIANDTTIYISNQNSNEVVKYPVGMLGQQSVFAHVGDPRGVALDPWQNLWAADKVTNSVVRYTPAGLATLQVPVLWPIGVIVFDNMLFVTSRSGPQDVLVFDIVTGKSKGNYSAAQINQACGLVIHNASNSLYVMSQRPNQIHRFNYHERTYAGTVTDALDDIPQHIIIVNMQDAPSSKKPINNKKNKNNKNNKNNKKNG